MSGTLIILVVSISCLSVAYFLYMRKEIKGQNLGTRSGNGSGDFLNSKNEGFF